MSEPHLQIKRTVVDSTRLPKPNIQAPQLISGNPSHTHIQTSSGTGYQAYTTVTSSHYVNGTRAEAHQAYASVLPQRASGAPEIEWSEYEDKLVVSGDTDFVALKTMKNAMLQLINEFKSRGNLAFEGEYRQNFQKRLILLEHQFEGLTRRVLNLKFMHPTDPRRSIDYSKFITDKENLIIELERKIANLEDRNRPNQEKIVQLEIESEALRKELINKNSYIQELSRQVEKGFGFNSSNKNDAVLGHITSLQAQITALKSKNPNLSNLQATVEGWISGLPQGSYLQRKLQSGTLRLKQDQLYSSMIQKLRYAQDLFAAQMSEVQRMNPTLNLSSRSKILEILSAPNARVSGVSASGVVQIQKEVRIEREVAVQDARTKALIVALGRYVKRLVEKYPKLREQMDVQLQEYISSEMIEIISEEDIDRIVSITKYVPQVVKVENVYTYSSEKTRKVEFYLRVLIKALLEELEKLKAKHGLALEIDEGVVGMIRAQILDLVDIDSILALFRSVPRVVQVPKYIEKVVDNIVTIPEKYVLRQKTTQVVPLAKTEVVKDQVGVPIRHDFPVEIIKQVPVKTFEHIEKPVIHTEYREVPVNQVIQRTKAIEVPTKVEVVYEKDCPVEIPGEERIIVQNQMQVVEVPKTDVRYIETVQEVLKPVEFVVQKLVQRLIERQKAVAVPYLQEKLVKETVYEVIKQNNPILVTKYEIVPQTHEKVVSFIQNRDNIVTVPQIVEKIVPVETVVELPPKLVEVKEQVMVKERVVEYVDVPRTEVVIKNEQVPVEVEKYIDRPLFVEVVKVEKEINNVPMMNEIVRQVHVPVEISKPCIVTQEVPVEINTTYPHYVKQEIPIFFKEESTVPIPYYYDRIKPEIQIVEKIIEKIVEVPKCVEVERIVEKIVIVPRIIEKIVEVPQIIERIVEKIVEVVKQLPPIERIVQKPCIVQKIVEVPVERIVYLTVEREKIVKEEVLVKDFETKTITVPQEIVNNRVVVETKERPVQMFRDRVEYMYVDDVKIVKTDNVIVHPVEVPIPIILQKDLPIPIRYETVHVLPVPHLVEKVVPQIEERVRIEKVDVVHNIPYIQEEVKFVDRERVVVQTKYEQVQLIQEKIVEMVTTIEQIKEVPLIYEQLVPLVKEVAKVYEFDKDPKIIQTPPRIQIIEKIKPYIVNVNKYIERIVQKLVEVPYLLRETNVQELIQQKMVAGPERHTHETEVVQLSVQKQLYREVEKKVIDTVHRISQVMKCATEIIQRDRDPVIITKDRIIQVPYVLEKIVQKIVVMPQVVEVLKYVHELIETDQINVLVDGDVEITQYKEIAVLLEREMGAFLEELKRVRTSQPQLASRVQVIQRYFAQFKKYIKQPKLFERVREVKSAPEKEIVRVPHAKTAEEAKEDLAKVLLIEQLLAALRKIGADNRNVNLENYLEKDVMGMFDVSFTGSVKKVNQNFKSQLKKFQGSIESKFSKLDGWGVDHNVMLKSFIDQRFQLANVIKRSKEINSQLTKENNELREKLERERDVPVKIIQLLIEFNQFMPRILSVVDREKHKQLYQSYNKLLKKFENFKKLYDSIIGDSHFGRTFEINEQFIQKYRGSSLREFVREIQLLKDKLRNSSMRQNEHSSCDATINKLKAEIVRLEGLHRESNTRMYVSEREVQSPKNSINTHISRERKAYESQYVPGSQSDVEAYGQNFGEYVVSDSNDAGLIGRREVFQTHGSSVQQHNLDLAGSAATYRSSQVITSTQNIRNEGNAGKLSIDSSKNVYEGGNMSNSSGSLGNFGFVYNNNVSIGDPNIVAYTNGSQAQGTLGANSSYGNNIKITTSRITSGETSNQAGVRQEMINTTGVTTNKREYKYHERKYERQG